MSELFFAKDCNQAIGPGAVLLGGFAAPWEQALHTCIEAVIKAAPWRHMTTPGGHVMSVAMSNCGAAGWVTDRRGYRYSATDPASGLPWPAMPEIFKRLAREAAAAAGYENFAPDACLLNRYEPGAKMTLHQDRDERDFTAPIVSISLGLPAVFLWGGAARTEKPVRWPLVNGDVLVWGGDSRLNFHGILPLKSGAEPHRINLTFRRAL